MSLYTHHEMYTVNGPWFNFTRKKKNDRHVDQAYFHGWISSANVDDIFNIYENYDVCLVDRVLLVCAQKKKINEMIICDTIESKQRRNTTTFNTVFCIQHSIVFCTIDRECVLLLKFHCFLINCRSFLWLQSRLF